MPAAVSAQTTAGILREDFGCHERLNEHCQLDAVDHAVVGDGLCKNRNKFGIGGDPLDVVNAKQTSQFRFVSAFPCALDGKTDVPFHGGLGYAKMLRNHGIQLCRQMVHILLPLLRQRENMIYIGIPLIFWVHTYGSEDICRISTKCHRESSPPPKVKIIITQTNIVCNVCVSKSMILDNFRLISIKYFYKIKHYSRIKTTTALTLQ